MDNSALAAARDNVRDVTAHTPRIRKGRVARVPLEPRGDARGSLIAIESGPHLFPIRRVYYIFDTAPAVVRGQHAHRELRQLLVCTSGACTIDTECDDGAAASFHLDSPRTGLLIEGLVWREMRDFAPNAVLMVLADQHYDEADYVRSYPDFLRLSGR